VIEQLCVTEGVAGVWHYHLSHPENWTRGLCGAQTMRTAIKVEDFGKPFGEHFWKRPTFCETCQRLKS